MQFATSRTIPSNEIAFKLLECTGEWEDNDIKEVFYQSAIPFLALTPRGQFSYELCVEKQYLERVEKQGTQLGHERGYKCCAVHPLVPTEKERREHRQNAEDIVLTKFLTNAIEHPSFYKHVAYEHNLQLVLEKYRLYLTIKESADVVKQKFFLFIILTCFDYCGLDSKKQLLARNIDEWTDWLEERTIARPEQLSLDMVYQRLSIMWRLFELSGGQTTDQQTNMDGEYSNFTKSRNMAILGAFLEINLENEVTFGGLKDEMLLSYLRQSSFWRVGCKPCAENLQDWRLLAAKQLYGHLKKHRPIAGLEVSQREKLHNQSKIFYQYFGFFPEPLPMLLVSMLREAFVASNPIRDWVLSRVGVDVYKERSRAILLQTNEGSFALALGASLAMHQLGARRPQEQSFSYSYLIGQFGMDAKGRDEASFVTFVGSAFLRAIQQQRSKYILGIRWLLQPFMGQLEDQAKRTPEKEMLAMTRYWMERLDYKEHRRVWVTCWEERGVRQVNSDGHEDTQAYEVRNSHEDITVSAGVANIGGASVVGRLRSFLSNCGCGFCG